MNNMKTTISSTLRYSVRRLLKKGSKQNFNYFRQTSTTTDSGKESNDKIIIPKRLDRGPTDILKALSGTVKRDYLAPHFKYHDDPFLIPTSNFAKRAFAMSQESGRKAAQWIREEHADLFQHRVADPPIEIFFPRAAVYDENSEVDENVLKEVIAQHRVSDALTIYGFLEKKNIELSRDVQQSLLELLCYYNNEDPLEEEWIEERWFKQGLDSRKKKTNRWKSGHAADKLFHKMSPPDAASYAALICGRAQFGHIEGANKMFKEALDSNLILPVEVFNKIIGGAEVLKESHELRWSFIEETLSLMHHFGVSPNLDTLNTILGRISTMSVNKNSRNNALSVMAEFREMGIVPSLASYCWLLRIFCQDRGSSRSSILINILDILEGQSLSIRDPWDVLFFTEAMEVCRFHLSDLDTAYRLDNLLHTADNYDLIGDSYKESLYYRNLFSLACQMGTWQEFMALYDKLVPNVYVPEPNIVEEILHTLKLNEAWDLLPRFWKDIVMFDQTDREPVLSAMLLILRVSTSTDPSLVEQHAKVAWAIWEKGENQLELRTGKRISWTGPMLGDMVQVLLRADWYKQALEVMSAIDKRQHQILGLPTVHTFVALLDKSIQEKDTKNGMWCVQFCHEAGFEETLNMAQKLNSSLELSSNEKSVLMNLVGRDTIEDTIAANN